MKYSYLFLFFFVLLSSSLMAGPGDTLVIKTFSFDSITTRRAKFSFPEATSPYGKILMYYTLKCDEATPHDKYPCGEWDYSTYTRVFNASEEKIKKGYPSFKVKNLTPQSYYYSDQPTWSVYSYYKPDGPQNDYYLYFEGDDYLQVPGEALASVRDEFTAAFWILGDASQPKADVVFEATDALGNRVLNLHLPYDNGTLYFDAGGYGTGKNDNIAVPLDPMHYKGVWSHYAVTKNNFTGIQRVYCNGVLLAEQETGKRSMNGITSLTIGASDNHQAQFFSGSLDEVMMWNKELTPAEIRRAMYPDAWELPAEDFLLLWYPVYNETATDVFDYSGNRMHAKVWGVPEIRNFGGLAYDFVKPRPGQPLLSDSVRNTRMHIVIYDDSLNPALATDTLFVFPGTHYIYGANGRRVDSVLAEKAKLLQRTTRYVEETVQKEEMVELARFITPYGKRLDLGLNGFTWVYDVTDYAPLLTGEVDLQAGNGQELLDLRFLFIEGTPEKDILKVRNVYPYGSYTYKNLADDKKLSLQMMRVDEQTKQATVRLRISGHGHAGPYNCCEWDPKTHYVLLNGDTLFHWSVWRECGMNPVFPQGGTWQFDRAGWCPGTFVDTYDFPVPDSILKRGIFAFDYAIEPYNRDNGEENGNFEIVVQYIEYGATNFRNDAAIDGVMAPSDQQEYRRFNPVSLNPVIRIKNCGSETLTQLNLRYGLQSGKKTHFQWDGSLKTGEKEVIILPAPSWKKMNSGEPFVAEVRRTNGRRDENPLNDSYLSVVAEPVFLPETFVVEVKTQNLGRAGDNHYMITAQDGTIVAAREHYPENELVLDTITLFRGAYSFVFYDKNKDGMIRHWWNHYSDPEQVGENGSLRICALDGSVILDLGYDWGTQRKLEFFVGKPY
ncbi:MAG: peptide-N-glycosidase F-related protein [Bacteroidales bacterium]|nr:peptide-N-glycosidase F-related protein [Bacteroidales bacterium]MDD3010031.1 peptide-N-glycosidase F-related protein [Bacteroidales bacterium]MDD3962471.1 peptide-N-glycosidase F-related protein [Bacteroidales bacterium]HPE87001.1 peptide-N-glycosidase F-related protein [Bacteroidales bacterium]